MLLLYNITPSPLTFHSDSLKATLSNLRQILSLQPFIVDITAFRVVIPWYFRYMRKYMLLLLVMKIWHTCFG